MLSWTTNSVFRWVASVSAAAVSDDEERGDKDAQEVSSSVSAEDKPTVIDIEPAEDLGDNRIQPEPEVHLVDLYTMIELLH